MTTSIADPEFSDADWSDQPIPDLGLAAAEVEGGGDPDDDPAGAGTVAPVDPEAPWGRFKNGKPKKKPRKSAAPARRMPAAPRRTAAKASGSGRSAGPDYEAMSRQGLAELTAVGGLIANFTRSPAIVADVVMVDLQADALAQISAQFAADEIRWARLLERFTTVSKWSAPISVGLALVVQGAVNHGLLPPGLMGSRPPAELLDLAEERARRAQAAADNAVRTAA